MTFVVLPSDLCLVVEASLYMVAQPFRYYTLQAKLECLLLSLINAILLTSILWAFVNFYC